MGAASDVDGALLRIDGDSSGSDTDGADSRRPAGRRLLDTDGADSRRPAGRRLLAHALPAMSACLVLCCIAFWPRRQTLHQPSTRVSGVMDAFLMRTWQPAYITWAKDPNKCWDVRENGKSVQAHQFRNGLRAQVYDCKDQPMRWLVPSSGEIGPLRPAANPNFCLDAPKNGQVLQLFNCMVAPKPNLMFKLPKGRLGIIQPDNDHSKCIDVEHQNTTNGHELQQWDCTVNLKNVVFEVHKPADCKWGLWTEWSKCAQDSCKSKRRRKEFQEHAGPTKSDLCQGVERQVRGCSPEEAKSCKMQTINLDDQGEHSKPHKMALP